MMQNYAPYGAVTAATRDNFLKYRDRYVGSISGESLGFPGESEPSKEIMAAARNHRDLAEALRTAYLGANDAKFRKVFGQEWPDSYREIIPCQSCGMVAFASLAYPWGARTVGYESSACTAGLLSLRMAFLRGAARQNGGMTATYRSCNFGDSGTIFSDEMTYSKPRNILDNYYSVFSGAGVTWYKMDIWYQYMAGSSMFYHEQGHDEYWIHGSRVGSNHLSASCLSQSCPTSGSDSLRGSRAAASGVLLDRVSPDRSQERRADDSDK
jgi:hypothetical protein